MRTTTLLSTIVASALIGSAHAATLIDYTFDGNAGNDVGPAVKEIDNLSEGDGTANTSTGAVTTAGNTSNVGFNSTQLVSTAGYDGFTVTYVVDSITLTPTVANLNYNGLFFGVVAGPNATDADATGSGAPSLWTNTPIALGYLPGSGTWNDHSVVYNDGTTTSGGGVDAGTVIASAQPTDGSLKDGFTFSLTVLNDGTWSISSTGLSTELSDSGTLAADFGASYSDFAYVGINTTMQGQAGGQYDLGRATITGIVPEPGSLALLGLGGALIASRRRRA